MKTYNVSEEDVAGFEQAAGDELIHVKAGGNDFLLVHPSEADWQRFQETVDKRGAAAVKSLFDSCVRFPEADALATLQRKRPAWLNTARSRFLNACQGREEEEGKKD